MPPTVLVIRGDDGFSAILRDNSCEVVNLPLITTSDAEDLTDLDERIDRINDYDGLFFTSPAAAKVFVGKLIASGNSFGGKVYVLGRRAKNVLDPLGLDIVFRDSANTGGELINSFDEHEFADKRFLFVRGEKSLRTIPELLKGKAQIDEIVVYRTLEIQPEDAVLRFVTDKLRIGAFDWVCFFSPSGVEGFSRLFGADAATDIKAAVIGETTAGKAVNKGFDVRFIARRAEADEFAAELVNYIKNCE